MLLDQERLVAASSSRERVDLAVLAETNLRTEAEGAHGQSEVLNRASTGVVRGFGELMDLTP
jgi:hypothetical protein